VCPGSQYEKHGSVRHRERHGGKTWVKRGRKATKIFKIGEGGGGGGKRWTGLKPEFPRCVTEVSRGPSGGGALGEKSGHRWGNGE